VHTQLTKDAEHLDSAVSVYLQIGQQTHALDAHLQLLCQILDKEVLSCIHILTSPFIHTRLQVSGTLIHIDTHTVASVLCCLIWHTFASVLSFLQYHLGMSCLSHNYKCFVVLELELQGSSLVLQGSRLVATRKGLVLSLLRCRLHVSYHSCTTCHCSAGLSRQAH